MDEVQVVKIHEQDTVVIKSSGDTVAVPSTSIEIVQAGLLGPPGLGDPGPEGPAGPAGPGADHFHYIQIIPATVWTINHNLGRIPAVTVIDSGGNAVEGEELHTTATVVLTFSAPFAGEAYLA